MFELAIAVQYLNPSVPPFCHVHVPSGVEPDVLGLVKLLASLSVRADGSDKVQVEVKDLNAVVVNVAHVQLIVVYRHGTRVCKFPFTSSGSANAFNQRPSGGEFLKLVFAGHIILPAQSIATPFGESEMAPWNLRTFLLWASMMDNVSPLLSVTIMSLSLLNVIPYGPLRLV
ncbi:hypothetical protein GBAR_LOCUS23759 [Geodia barretti]|uniref:Uncharacterized protein n=1 Tax=Geodia barretti TaxID=519541 RepID=A0AA35T7S1_GEOBA|nr:hypothetical protein GBAR_LOCUS23759 [Geodia barretti]